MVLKINLRMHGLDLHVLGASLLHAVESPAPPSRELSLSLLERVAAHQTLSLAALPTKNTGPPGDQPATLQGFSVRQAVRACTPSGT